MGPPGYRSVMRWLTNGLRHPDGAGLATSSALTRAVLIPGDDVSGAEVAVQQHFDQGAGADVVAMRAAGRGTREFLPCLISCPEVHASWAFRP